MKTSMHKSLMVASAFCLAMGAGQALAHSSTNTITFPLEGAEITVDSLPTVVNVTGTITHSPGNVNSQVICVRLDGTTDTCLPALGGLGNTQSYGYSVPVSIDTAGAHTLQGRNANTSGDHPGISATVNITIILSQDVICDDRAPPAHANQYLNSLGLPQSFAKLHRGQVINAIAHNFNAGVYGTCQYDYAAVEADVYALLVQLGYF